MSILIKNTKLLSMKAPIAVQDGMDVFIDGKYIKEIGQNLEVKAGKVIDGSDKLLMPGLINGHTHLGMSYFRNLADDMNLQRWLNEKIWPLEAHLQPEDIYWGSLLSMIEIIKSGGTAFCDMYDYMHEVGKAADKIGMRGVIGQGLIGFNDPDLKKLEGMRELYKAWHGQSDGKMRVIVSPHAPYTCSGPYIKKCMEMAEELGVGIHIHLSETKQEVKDSLKEHDMTPIEYVASLGLLEHHVVAAHCVHMTDEEFDLVEGKDFFPMNNPTSNLKLASGFAPVNRWLKADICAGLGTDGSSSNNNVDIWREMHLASILNKAVDEDPLSVNAAEALQMATKNGAKALGFEDLGTLEPGKVADMILIDIDNLHFRPHHNLVSALVYSGTAEDVNTTIINGEIVMENREICHVNEDEVIAKVDELTEKLLYRAEKAEDR